MLRRNQENRRDVHFTYRGNDERSTKRQAWLKGAVNVNVEAAPRCAFNRAESGALGPPPLQE